MRDPRLQMMPFTLKVCSLHLQYVPRKNGLGNIFIRCLCPQLYCEEVSTNPGTFESITPLKRRSYGGDRL